MEPHKKHLDFSYQGAFIRHDLDYRDPTINLVSPSTFNTFINNAETNFSFKKGMSLTTGANYTWKKGRLQITDLRFHQKQNCAC